MDKLFRVYFAHGLHAHANFILNPFRYTPGSIDTPDSAVLISTLWKIVNSLWLLFSVFVFLCLAPFFISYATARLTEAENLSRPATVPIGAGAATVRIFVVVLCYGLSGPGLFLLIVAASGMLLNPGLRELTCVTVWIYAWLCHAVMCRAWVANRQLAKFWLLSGSVSGIVGFLVIPTISAIEAQGGEFPMGFEEMFPFLFMELLLVLPCFLLALYLTVFHLQSRRVG